MPVVIVRPLDSASRAVAVPLALARLERDPPLPAWVANLYLHPPVAPRVLCGSDPRTPRPAIANQAQRQGGVRQRRAPPEAVAYLQRLRSFHAENARAGAGSTRRGRQTQADSHHPALPPAEGAVLLDPDLVPHLRARWRVSKKHATADPPAGLPRDAQGAVAAGRAAAPRPRPRTSTLYWSSSSWAMNLLRSLTYFFTTGCLKVRSTATTTVFCALSPTTVPRIFIRTSQGAVVWNAAAPPAAPCQRRATVAARPFFMQRAPAGVTAPCRGLLRAPRTAPQLPAPPSCSPLFYAALFATDGAEGRRTSATWI
jgi:hypothetical protein